MHLAETLIERDRSYSEREVDEALLTVHEDCSAPRRHPVVAGLPIRPPGRQQLPARQVTSRPRAPG